MGLLDNFVPDDVVLSVAQIDLDDLERRGIRGVLIDVDNTLIGHGSVEMTPERLEWAHEAMERFHVCMVSNSVRGKRVARLCDVLGCEGIAVWSWDRKPFKSGIRRAMRMIGTTAEESVMIGDQLLTDVWGGNRAGLHTIWVEQILKKEFFFTRLVNRIIEGYIARRLDIPTFDDKEPIDE